MNMMTNMPTSITTIQSRRFHNFTPRRHMWPAGQPSRVCRFTPSGRHALGSAVLGQETPKDLGLAVFLATVLHKPADSLTISTLLIKAGTQRSRTLVVQFCFALLIPIGVLMFHLGQSAIASHVGNAFTGSVLAFSAGTFICIALSDLLPEVQFHSHDRMKLFLAFILGAVLMWGTALIETH
jgi:zinc and cadmium transporter